MAMYLAHVLFLPFRLDNKEWTELSEDFEVKDRISLMSNKHHTPHALVLPLPTVTMDDTAWTTQPNVKQGPQWYTEGPQKRSDGRGTTKEHPREPSISSREDQHG